MICSADQMNGFCMVSTLVVNVLEAIEKLRNLLKVTGEHCVKSFHIRSYSGPYFPAFGLSPNDGKCGPE